jgi:hypothetical protein
MENFIMGRSTALALWSIKIREYMKASGLMIKRKALGLKNFQINASIKANTRMESLTGLVVTLGQMDNIMMDNG